MNLQDLPVETIARIFGFLNWSDLLVVSQLNSFFRDVYCSFPELKYSYALQVSGMVDTHEYYKSTYSRGATITEHDGHTSQTGCIAEFSSFGGDIRTKTGAIQDREYNWRRMDLRDHFTRVVVPHRTSHIYDLSGGVYLLGDCKHSVISRDTHSLRSLDLNRCTRSGPPVIRDPWPEMKIEGCNIVDIGFALHEFDLVAVVCVKPGQHGEQSNVILSLRELSTGAPHPLARNPDIVVDPVEDNQLLQGKLSIMLEIVGPRLLLLLTWHRSLQRVRQREQDKLFLFNWWEGTKVVTEVAPQQRWDGFVFLSPEHVLLPDRERGLDIIRLPDVTKGYSAKGFERILRLTFPAPFDLIKVGAIQCRSEPNPIGEPHPGILNPTSGEWKEDVKEFSARMRAKRRPPVVADPEKAIVLLQIYYREFNNEPHDVFMGQWGVLRHNVSLVVHREFLMGLVRVFESESKKKASEESLNGVATNGYDDANGNVNGHTDAEGDSTGAQRDLPPTPTSPTSPTFPSLSPSSSDQSDFDNVPIIPWANWGLHARWMADDTHVSNWITTSAGQRYVGTDEEGRIVVKDFNPVSVKRARAAMRGAAALAIGEGEDAGREERIENEGEGEGDAVMNESGTETNGWDEDGSRPRGTGGESGDADVRMNIPGAFEPSGEFVSIEEQDIEMDEAAIAGASSSPSSQIQTREPSQIITNPSAPLLDDTLIHLVASTSGPRPQTQDQSGEEKKSFLSPTSSEFSLLAEQLEAEVVEESWRNVRVIEGYNEIEEIELSTLFSEDCKWPLPCVEYVSKERYDYHGLLMDEERIIGLRHDEHTGAIVQFDVFPL